MSIRATRRSITSLPALPGLTWNAQSGAAKPQRSLQFQRGAPVGRAQWHDAPDIQGCVARSRAASIASACVREPPHISTEGRRLAQTAGRLGCPNRRQPHCASSCTHGTPAGLPCGMPGIGELMDGAMQHAAQPERHERVEVMRTV